MKRCSVCKKNYNDDGLNYCLDDGAILYKDNSLEKTLKIPPFNFHRPKTQSFNPLFIYLILGLLVFIGIIGIAIWLKIEPANNIAATKSEQTTPTPIIPTVITEANNNNSEIIYSKIFIGKINYNENIEMRLKRNGKFLSGIIYNTTAGFEDNIEGTIDENQGFVLKELNKVGKQTGWYKGRFTSNTEIEGFWTKPNGTFSTPFFVKERLINLIEVRKAFLKIGKILVTKSISAVYYV